ncbi:MAG TPA: hypothetical protein PKD61_21695, partial [Polyangiaceae bacterium]|nr:hypothetical protein [Polyangiaceae bacterium]
PASASGWALVLGAGSRLAAESEVAGEFDEPLAEAIIDRLRARFASLGQVSRLGNTLTFSTGPPATQRVVEFSVASRSGRTTIRATENLANLAGGMFGGIVGGVGGGGLGLILPLTARFFGSAMLPVLALVWLVAVYAVVRRSFARLASTRDRELRAAVDEVAAIIQGESQPRARIELPADADAADADAADVAHADSEAAEAEAAEAKTELRAAERRGQ